MKIYTGNFSIQKGGFFGGAQFMVTVKTKILNKTFKKKLK